MDGSRVQVRRARTGDAGAVAGLAGELAQLFPFSREQFDLAQDLAPRRVLRPGRVLTPGPLVNLTAN